VVAAGTPGALALACKAEKQDGSTEERQPAQAVEELEMQEECWPAAEEQKLALPAAGRRSLKFKMFEVNLRK
jgi:hypothetical protein